MPSEKEGSKSLMQRLALKSRIAKETISEFLGTFIMIVLGCGSIAQAVLSRGQAGGVITIYIGFAMAVVMAVYVTGGVSGGHINPAVTFAMCAFRRMEWFKFPFYVGAQFLGAFVGAATVFGVYYDGFMAFANGKLLIEGENATAPIFATYPAPFISLTNAFADQSWKQLLVDSCCGPYGWRFPWGPHLHSLYRNASLGPRLRRGGRAI
ncbi:aquaporin-9 isoform X2 [Psammomys obesus]|uniref:aquaporin-9 isoform X2 n=1 Tax=Psammomys obesus TaxID=48139 RepID=UPI002452B7D9|nr:aquaporin-9 isoform X2 [Psammomys obesus]